MLRACGAQVRSAFLHFLGCAEAVYQALAAKLQARRSPPAWLVCLCRRTCLSGWFAARALATAAAYMPTAVLHVACQQRCWQLPGLFRDAGPCRPD